LPGNPNIIDQLTETKSNTELRLLSQRLQRLAFHANAGLDETLAHQASWSASFQLVKHALDEIALRDLSLPIAGAARICD
jgi:hypothetical protein